LRREWSGGTIAYYFEEEITIFGILSVIGL